MSHRLHLLPGLALLIAGLGRIAIEIMSARTLALPTCLGETILVRVNAPAWSVLHCWGCYAALAGLGLLAAAILQRQTVRQA